MVGPHLPSAGGDTEEQASPRAAAVGIGDGLGTRAPDLSSRLSPMVSEQWSGLEGGTYIFFKFLFIDF